jgi:acyl carrier protein
MSTYQADLAIAANGDRATIPDTVSLTEAQETVRAIWKSVLGSQAPREIGDDDDFFEIGGTSLSLISVVAEMSVRFGADLSTAILLDGATVAAMTRGALAERASAQDK